jgi:hypothetical protein
MIAREATDLLFFFCGLAETLARAIIYFSVLLRRIRQQALDIHFGIHAGRPRAFSFESSYCLAGV